MEALIVDNQEVLSLLSKDLFVHSCDTAGDKKIQHVTALLQVIFTYLTTWNRTLFNPVVLNKSKPME